jgi:ATP-dependent exoDNAse (exonuclease V) beta subunit
VTALQHDGRLVGPGGRAFTDEQAEAIRRRDGALLLAAGAGSGKTSVLVERFARMVAEDGIPARRIVAITFTEKAAGELRARIRARLLELRLRDAAREAEAAWISTIHGFCARLLRGNAVAAGLDPDFAVLDEAAARALRREAFEAALGTWLGDPAGPVRAAQLDLAAAYTADRLGEAVAAVHDELRSRGATRPALPRAIPPDRDAALRALRSAAADAAADLRDARALPKLDAAREAIGACAGALGALAPGEHVPPGDVDGWSFAPGGVAELLRAPAGAFLEACAAYRRACVDAAAAEALALVDELLGAYADAYAAAKRARSAVDFADLELMARDLLRAQPAVARGVRTRFERLMVDEFQDTNPLQLELLELLGLEHVFVVGDELQSIYGFRHADVDVFRRRRAELEAEGRAPTLATSFRAHPELLATLDAAFGPGHGPGYVPLVAGREDPPAAQPLVELLVTDAGAWDGTGNGERRDPVASPELLAAVTAGLDADRASLAAEARLVARRVRTLVDERAFRAKDVVVLVRALGAMPPLERALQDAGLATLAGGGRGWWGRAQVADLLAWLATLANPRDEEALLGVLASPLCGASPDALALLALARPAAGAALWDVLSAAYLGGDGDGLRGRMPPADDTRLAAVARRLADERAVAPRHGLDELIERAVRAARYDEHVLALPGGLRRLANVRKLQRLAAAFEAREGRDVRGFVDLALAELEADAVETDAPVDLGDQDAVRLMTMHAAKGLEFPVVVCAGLGRRGGTRMPAVLVDGSRVGLRLATLEGGSERALDFDALAERRREREIAEERRVLHVAMTRAEELLILSGTAALGAKWPKEGHGCPPISWIGPALLPGVASALTPEEPEHVATVGTAGGRARIVLNAPATVGRVLRPPAPPAPPERRAPAERRAPPEPPAPAEPLQLTLDLPAAAPPAVTPAPPPVSTLSYSSLGAYRACGYRYYLERILRLPEVEPPPHLRPEPGRSPDARLRGSIVHALLEGADLRPGSAPPGEAEVRAVAADLDAALRDEDVADVLRLLGAFARSGVRDRLAAARDVRREHPFALPLGPDPETAPLLNGVVDVLAFEPDGTALVVDYKTDRVDDEDLAALVARDYALQRAAYALAALRAGAPAAEIVHLYLERAAEPVAARFGPADVPALERQLTGAAAGLLAGAFPVAPVPHAGLCATCPGRGGLCSWPTELTDRPVSED